LFCVFAALPLFSLLLSSFSSSLPHLMFCPADGSGYALSEEPFNLAQQTGAYETAYMGGAHGRVARQMSLQTPVYWCDADNINKSINIVGDSQW
jgi:hypothetical protein